MDLSLLLLFLLPSTLGTILGLLLLIAVCYDKTEKMHKYKPLLLKITIIYPSSPLKRTQNSSWQQFYVPFSMDSVVFGRNYSRCQHSESMAFLRPWEIHGEEKLRFNLYLK